MDTPQRTRLKAIYENRSCKIGVKIPVASRANIHECNFCVL